MLVIRPVKQDDLDGLYRLAEIAGSGFTSLPSDHEVLASKIEMAEATFNRDTFNKDDYFLLVMEDTEKQKVVGTAAAYSGTGSRQAFYAYRLMSVTHYSHSLDKESRTGLLHLTNEYTDCSEVGTLFLDPEYRGNGHWLSRSRYMLMAQHSHRFAEDVIAELRGWMDENNESPVWNAIGAHFFNMSFDEADRLSGVGSNQFITELMPKYPIYTNLLSEQARAALGKPNDAGVRAMELLLEEGFVFENLVDIFDGGPLVRGRINQLKSVRSAQTGKLKISENLPIDKAAKKMIAKSSLAEFRLVYQVGQKIDDDIEVSAEARDKLQLDIADPIMIMG